MLCKETENRPNGYTSRQMAFADARFVVASLCASDRSQAYKAAIAEALRAIEAAAPPDLESAPAPVSEDDTMWRHAVAEAGTVRVAPYTSPVIVLSRPAEVGALFRSIAKRMGFKLGNSMGLAARDRERTLYAGRVLRAIADVGPSEPIGSLAAEAATGARGIQAVLELSDEKAAEVGLVPQADVPGSAESALGTLTAGWKEAAFAWDTCVSIHRAFARGKDPVFDTRHPEFVKRAALARGNYEVVARPALASVDI